MLTLPAEIKAQAGSQVVSKPLLMLDIWADRGAEGSLDSQSDWAGAADPYVASDVNMDFVSLSGSAILAAGGYVASAYTAPDIYATTLTATATVASPNVTSPPYIMPFNKAATETVNEVSVVITPSIKWPNLGQWWSLQKINTMTLRAWILDADGNLVGSVASSAVTPSNTRQAITLSGFRAFITAFQDYSLNMELSFTSTVVNLPNNYITVNARIYGCAQGTTANQWRLAPFNAGGWEAFQASGSMQRVIDVGAIPSASGSIEINDTVPGIGSADSTSLSITAEYSSTGTSGPWTTHGAIADGASVPAFRYWRFTIAMASNSTGDRTPTLDRLAVSFRGAPTTFATRGDIQNGVSHATNALSTVSSLSAQLSEKASGAMVGEMRPTLADVPEFREILKSGADRLAIKGADSRIRAGYVDVKTTTAEAGVLLYPIPMTVPWIPVSSGDVRTEVPITFDLYNGTVYDVKFSRGVFTPVLRDYIDIADVSIPKATSGPWASVVYTSQHLADIALDLLINQANLRTSFVDAGSLATVKAAFPLRICSRTITKPVSVSEALGEIAFLLESQWVVRGGKLALILEPTAADPVVERITPSDIERDSLSWAYGWDRLKNAISTFTGYTGDGSSDNEVFTSGEGLIDAPSVNAVGQTQMEIAYDKWGMPTAEITAMNLSFITRMKLGRQAVSFTASFRLIHLEPGDRVSIQSAQIPTDSFEAVVVRKDIDWGRQTLKITVLEVF